MSCLFTTGWAYMCAHAVGHVIRFCAHSRAPLHVQPRDPPAHSRPAAPSRRPGPPYASEQETAPFTPAIPSPRGYQQTGRGQVHPNTCSFENPRINWEEYYKIKVKPASSTVCSPPPLWSVPPPMVTTHTPLLCPSIPWKPTMPPTPLVPTSPTAFSPWE